MLNERKLTERELDKRAEAIQGLLSNKRTLVKKYGKDAEKVMYGIATKQAKSKVESMNKEKIKELIQQALQVEDTSTIDTGFSGRADYGEEDKALGQEDELEMRGLEEGHGLDQGDLDTLESLRNQIEQGILDKKNRIKFVKVLDFLIKSNILQDKTKDLSIKEDKFSNAAMNDVMQSIRNLAHTTGMDELEAAEIAINEIKIEFGVDAFHESINESAEKWNKLSNDQKLDLLLQAFENPDEAEKYVEFKWNDLPDVATQNMRLGEDLDIGHQDNEPHMLKKELARAGQMIQMLYRAVDNYDGQGEVDFPQWWQAKIIKANSMLDSAFDYLDGEEMVAKIDAMIDGADKVEVDIDVVNEDEVQKRLDAEKAIKSTLKDEGGAAGLEPLAKAVKKLGISKDELLKMIKKVVGVAKHKHGDYISTPINEIDYDEALTLRGMLADLKKEREQLFRDMEQEAEPEGGPIADRYGSELNKIEDRMYKIAKQLRDYDMNEATKQDLGMSSSVSKRRAKAELKNPGNDGSKVYGLDKDGKRVHIKSINDVDKFKKFELDADLNEGTDNEKELKGQEMVDYIMKNWDWSEEKTLKFLANRLGNSQEIKEAMDGGTLFDYFNKEYVVDDHFHSDDSYIVKREPSGKDQYVIFDYDKDKDQFQIRQMGGYRIDQKDAIKAGMRETGMTRVAGIDSYMVDGNYSPTPISIEGLKDIVDHVMGGLSREAAAQQDYYARRGPTSGTIDEKIATAVKEKLTKSSSVEDHVEDFKDSDAPQFKGKSLKKIKQMALASFLQKQGKKKVAEGFKVGQKVTYLGHPAEITKVNKEMTGATTYNVSYDKGTGKTKASNIYNKGGEIKAA